MYGEVIRQTLSIVVGTSQTQPRSDVFFFVALNKVMEEFGGAINNKDEHNNEVIDSMMTISCKCDMGVTQVLRVLHQSHHDIYAPYLRELELFQGATLITQ